MAPPVKKEPFCFYISRYTRKVKVSGIFFVGK